MKSLTGYFTFSATLATAAYAIELESSTLLSDETCDCTQHYNDLKDTIATLEEQLAAFNDSIGSCGGDGGSTGGDQDG